MKSHAIHVALLVLTVLVFASLSLHTSASVSPLLSALDEVMIDMDQREKPAVASASSAAVVNPRQPFGRYKQPNQPTAPRPEQFGSKPTVTTPKVFGIGLSRTGGTSLATALKELGLTCVFFDRDFNAYLPHSAPYSFAGLYDDVDCVLDLPTAFYPAELLSAYPSAKFIATHREPQAWFNSFSQYLDVVFQGYMPTVLRRLHETVYGSEMPNEAVWIQSYKKHYFNVAKVIPQSQLMTLEVESVKATNPFPAICKFIGLTSCVDKAYPHENSLEKKKGEVGSINADRLASEAAIRSLGEKEAKSNYAYVTLLSGTGDSNHKKEFIYSSIVWCKTVKESYSAPDTADLDFDVVAMTTDDLSAADADLLKTCFTRIVPIEAEEHGPRGMRDNAFWRALRSKFSAWSLTEYSRVIFMDADQMVVKNLDELFFRGYYESLDENKGAAHSSKSTRGNNKLSSDHSTSGGLGTYGNLHQRKHRHRRHPKRDTSSTTTVSVTPTISGNSPPSSRNPHTHAAPPPNGLFVPSSRRGSSKLAQEETPAESTASFPKPKDLYCLAAVAQSPVNTAIMSLAPSMIVSRDISALFAYGDFSEENGWFEYGLYSFDYKAYESAGNKAVHGKTSELVVPTFDASSIIVEFQRQKWDFYAAWADQGMTLYYFYLLNPSMGGVISHELYFQGVIHFIGGHKPWLHGGDSANEVTPEVGPDAAAWQAAYAKWHELAAALKSHQSGKGHSVDRFSLDSFQKEWRNQKSHRRRLKLLDYNSGTSITTDFPTSNLLIQNHTYHMNLSLPSPAINFAVFIVTCDDGIVDPVLNSRTGFLRFGPGESVAGVSYITPSSMNSFTCYFDLISADTKYPYPGSISFNTIGVSADCDGNIASNGQSTLHLNPSVAPVGGLTVDVSCNFGSVSPSRLVLPDDSTDGLSMQYTAPGFAARVVCSTTIVAGLSDPRFVGGNVADITFNVYPTLAATVPEGATIGNNIDITLTPSQAIVGSALVIELACDSGVPTNRLRYNFPVGSKAAQKVTYGISQFLSGTPIVQCNFTQISGDNSFVNHLPEPFTITPNIGLTITSSASLPSTDSSNPVAPGAISATLTITPTTTIATADLTVNVLCTLQGAVYPSGSTGTLITFAVGTKTAAQVPLNVAASDYGQLMCTAIPNGGDERYAGMWVFQTYIAAALTWTKYPNVTDVITADSSVILKLSANVPVIGALSLNLACTTDDGTLPSTPSSFDWADGEKGERSITVSFGGTYYGAISCQTTAGGSTTDMRYSWAYDNLNGVRFTAYSPIKITSQFPAWDTPYTVSQIPYYASAAQYFTEPTVLCQNCQAGNPTWDISLPFVFSFFGRPETELCLGGTYLYFGSCGSYYSRSGAPPDYNTVNPPSVISLGISDSIVFRAVYYVIGDAPDRRFYIELVATNSKNNALILSGSIILYESTNIVDVRLNEARSFSSNSQFVGLQNYVGDTAVVVPGLGAFDYGWEVANKAFRFTPTTIPVVPMGVWRSTTAYPLVVPNADGLSLSFICSTRTGSFNNGFGDNEFYNEQYSFGPGATVVNATTYSVNLPNVTANTVVTCNPSISGGDVRFSAPYGLTKSFTFAIASVEVDLTFFTTGWYSTLPTGTVFPVTLTPSVTIKDSPLVFKLTCNAGTAPTTVTFPVGSALPLVFNITAPKTVTASVTCNFAYSSGDSRFASVVPAPISYSTAVFSVTLNSDIPTNKFSIADQTVNINANVSVPSGGTMYLLLECVYARDVKNTNLLAKGFSPFADPLFADVDPPVNPSAATYPEFSYSVFKGLQFFPSKPISATAQILPYYNSGMDTTCTVSYYYYNLRYRYVHDSFTFHNANFTGSTSFDYTVDCPGPLVAKNSVQTASIWTSRPVVDAPVKLQLVCYDDIGNYAAPLNLTIPVGSKSGSVSFTTFDATSTGTTVNCYWQYNPDDSQPAAFSGLQLPSFCYTSFPVALSVSNNLLVGTTVVTAWTSSITVVPSVQIVGTPLVISISCTTGTLASTKFSFPVNSLDPQSVSYTTASTFGAGTCTFAYVSGDSRFQNQLPPALSFSTGTGNWLISGTVTNQYYHPVSTSRTLVVALPIAPSGSTLFDVICNGATTTLTFTSAAAQTVTFTTPSDPNESFTCSVAYNSGDSSFNIPTRTLQYQTIAFSIYYNFNYSTYYSPNNAPVVPPNTLLRLSFTFDHQPEVSDIVLTPQCTGAKITSPNGGKMTLVQSVDDIAYFDLVTPPSGNVWCILTKNSGSSDWDPALAIVAPHLYFNTTAISVSFVANNSIVAYDRPVPAVLTGNVLAAPVGWLWTCDSGYWTGGSPNEQATLFTDGISLVGNTVSYIGDTPRSRVQCRLIYSGSDGPSPQEQPYFHSLDSYNVMLNVVDYNYVLTPPFDNAAVVFVGQAAPFTLTPSYYTANETGMQANMTCYFSSSNSYKTYTFAFPAHSLAPVTISPVFSAAGFISCNFSVTSPTTDYATFHTPDAFAFTVMAAPTLSATTLPAIVFSGEAKTVAITPSISIFRQPLNIAYSCIGAPAAGILNFPVSTSTPQSFTLNVPVGQDIDSASCSFSYAGGDSRFKSATLAPQSFRVIFPRLTATSTLPPPFVFPITTPSTNGTGNGTDSSSLPSLFNNVTLPQIPVVVRAGDNFTFSVNANTPVVDADVVLSFQCTSGTYLQLDVNATSVTINNASVPALTIPVGSVGPASILYFAPLTTEVDIVCTLSYASGDNRFALFTQSWQFDAIAPPPPTVPTTPLIFGNSTYTNVNDLQNSPVPQSEARITVSLSFPASASVGTQPASYWTDLVASFASTLSIDPARLQLQIVDFPQASNSSSSASGSTVARLVFVVLPPVNGGLSYNASSPTASTDLLSAEDIAAQLNTGFKASNSPLNQKLAASGIGVESVSVQTATVPVITLTEGDSGSSGLSQGAKIGIGVGVGVGGALVIVGVAVLLKSSAAAAAATAKVADTTTITIASAPTNTVTPTTVDPAASSVDILPA